MIKKIISAALAALVMLTTTGCSLTKRDLEEKIYDTEIPPKILFLGDSIAAGYGLDGYSPDDNYSCPDSYANILNKRYASELPEIFEQKMYNCAVSGETSSTFLNLIESGKLDTELSQADAVVVSIGGNDLLNIILDSIRKFGLSAENKALDFSEFNIMDAISSLFTLEDDIDAALINFEENLQAISNELNSRTNGTVFIQTLYNPFESFMNIQMVADFSNEKINRFNEIVKSNSTDNYKIIDVAKDFEGKCDELTRIADWDIHPNEKGHTVIAGSVDKAFRETGFTVTVLEYGEPHLTLSAILLIIGGILAMLLVVMLIIPSMFKKY